MEDVVIRRVLILAVLITATCAASQIVQAGGGEAPLGKIGFRGEMPQALVTAGSKSAVYFISDIPTTVAAPSQQWFGNASLNTVATTGSCCGIVSVPAGSTATLYIERAVTVSHDGVVRDLNPGTDGPWLVMLTGFNSPTNISVNDAIGYVVTSGLPSREALEQLVYGKGLRRFQFMEIDAASGAVKLAQADFRQTNYRSPFQWIWNDVRSNVSGGTTVGATATPTATATPPPTVSPTATPDCRRRC